MLSVIIEIVIFFRNDRTVGVIFPVSGARYHEASSLVSCVDVRRERAVRTWV